MNARATFRTILRALADVLWLLKRWVRAKGRREAVAKVREFRDAARRRDGEEVSRMLDDLLLHARGAGVLRRLPPPGGGPQR